MKERGVNNPQLAARANISIGSVQKYVTGQRVPKAEPLSSIAHALSVEEGMFFQENPSPLAPIDMPAFVLHVIDDRVPSELKDEAEKLAARLNERFRQALNADQRRPTRPSSSSVEDEERRILEAEAERDRIEAERIEEEIAAEEEGWRPKAKRRPPAAKPSPSVRGRSPPAPEKHGRPR